MTYHIDELDESQTKRYIDLLGHVLYWANELVVTSEEVPHQPFLLL